MAQIIKLTGTIDFSSWVGLLVGAVVLFQNNFSERLGVGKRSKGSYNWFPWRIHPPTLHHFSSLKFSNFGHETVRIFGTWWWSPREICQFSKPHLSSALFIFSSLNVPRLTTHTMGPTFFLLRKKCMSEWFYL